MTDWRPLLSRPGQRTDVKFDSDGRVIILTRQDDTDIIEQNKHEQNHGGNPDFLRGVGRKIARIPNNIIFKWLQEGIDVYSGDCQVELARKLNDPDNRYLRVNTGHIGVSNGVAR